MKNKNTILWLFASLTVVSFGVAAVGIGMNMSRKKKEMAQLIAFAKNDGSAKYGDWNDLRTSKGFDVNYWKKGLQTKLSYDTYRKIADDILAAITGIGANANKVYEALNRVQNLTQLSQVASFYSEKNKEGLLDALDSETQVDMNKVYDIIKKLS